MFRTRDFCLVLVVVVFLLISIGATWLNQEPAGVQSETSTLSFIEPSATDYSAFISTPETISREARLDAMRKKIAATQSLTLTEPVNPPEPEPELEVSEEEVAGLQRCSDYATYQGSWEANEIHLEEVEGARIVYKKVESDTTSTTSSAVNDKELLLQLPLSPWPAPAPNCIATDVIGIAKDGSLIKNQEVELYGVFGEDTLVGYALDGYPIYGASTKTTDVCGGRQTAGSYRYYLSTERENILNCFAAKPAGLF